MPTQVVGMMNIIIVTVIYSYSTVRLRGCRCGEYDVWALWMEMAHQRVYIFQAKF